MLEQKHGLFGPITRRSLLIFSALILLADVSGLALHWFPGMALVW